MAENLRIGVIAGEASGDLLGADLITQLKRMYPNAEFSGMGGHLMKSAGLTSLFELDRLAVMGFVEPLKRLPELLSMRRKLVRHFLKQKVDVFIGIDSPEFNLGVASKLHREGIKTVHYVSPSVWAWRQGRIKGIRKSVDLMLTLFPFESRFYREHNVPVEFVGHPLTTEIPGPLDRITCRQELGLDLYAPLVTLMPGSRRGEIDQLLPLFTQVAKQLTDKTPEVGFVLPAVNQKIKQHIEEQLDIENCKVVLADSRRAIGAADAVLVASGTSTLEIMLLNRPMVVAYRLGTLTYQIVKRLLKTPYVAIPNLLANSQIVPEYLQKDATVDNLSGAIGALLAESAVANQQLECFARLVRQLGGNSATNAASAIQNLIES